MEVSRRAPKRWLYVLAAVFFGAFLAVNALLIVRFGQLFKDDRQRVSVPDSCTVALDKPREYAVYHEYANEDDADEESADSRELRHWQCAVTSKASGRSVPVHRVSGREIYRRNGRYGVAVWRFRIDQAGNYEVSAEYRGSLDGQQAVLAVAPAFPFGEIFILIGTGALGISLFFAGTVTVAVIVVKKLTGEKHVL